MHLRKKRLATVPLEEDDALHEGPAKWEHGNDDLQLTGTVDRIMLDRAVAELPFGYRTAFLLHGKPVWMLRMTSEAPPLNPTQC